MSTSPLDTGPAPSETDPAIQPADLGLRRKVLGALALVALVGCYGVVRLEAYFQKVQLLAKSDLVQAAEKAQRVSDVLFLVLAVGMVVFGGYLLRLSLRVLKTRRFPPPGTRVISDTKVLQGKVARIYGGTLLVLSLAILVAAVVVPWTAAQKVQKVLTITLEPTPQTPEELGLGR